MLINLTLVEVNDLIAIALEKKGVQMGNDPFFTWVGEDGKTIIGHSLKIEMPLKDDD